MPDSEHTAAFGGIAETPGAQDSGRARRWLVAAGALLLGAGVVWLGYWWLVGRFLETTNNAYLQADAVVISPKVSGYVEQVLVEDNEAVVAGAPLVRIDSAPYQAAQDMAEAEVAQRRADLVRFRADLARQQAVRDEALARVKTADAAVRFAVSDAARFAHLAQTGVAAAQRAEQTASASDQAAGGAAAARAAAEVAVRQLDSLQAQIGQGEAALLAAEAKARGTHSDLKGVDIAAPVAGRVGDRTVRVGQYVQPGTRLMTLVPVQNIYLVANFKETQVGRMRAGQAVQVRIDALPDAKISGVVDSLAPGTGAEFALLPPENATGNFTKIVQRVPVRIRLNIDPALRDQLRPGLSAEAEVDTAQINIPPPGSMK